MPDEKIQGLDDIITDMNIETITLDDVELSDIESLQPVSTEPFISNNLSSSEEVSYETVHNPIGDSSSQISIPNLDVIQNTPEPEIPSENPMEFDESIKKESSLYSKREGMDVLNKLFTSEDDIISIEGSELDKLIYGDLSGDLIYKAPTYAPTQEESAAPVKKPGKTANIIDDIPVLEEAAIEEEIPIIMEETVKEENLIPAMDLGIEEIDLTEEPSSDKEFNFDLSAIPDVSRVEEDEPIALSIDELNKIDISDGNVIDYEAPQVPEVSISAIETEEDENVEISLDELNRIEADMSQSDKISPDAYVFESPESIEQKEQIIDEKIDPLSSASKEELKKVLKYIDKLLENLPEEKIKEFAKSEYYDLYSKILNKLGI